MLALAISSEVVISHWFESAHSLGLDSRDPFFWCWIGWLLRALWWSSNVVFLEFFFSFFLFLLSSFNYHWFQDSLNTPIYHVHSLPWQTGRKRVIPDFIFIYHHECDWCFINSIPVKRGGAHTFARLRWIFLILSHIDIGVRSRKNKPRRCPNWVGRIHPSPTLTLKIPTLQRRTKRIHRQWLSIEWTEEDKCLKPFSRNFRNRDPEWAQTKLIPRSIKRATYIWH